MGKVVDITDKLSFDGNPALLIKGEEIEVNADAPTMLKIMNLMQADKNVDEMELFNQAYDLVFSAESKKKIDDMKLLFTDWTTVIRAAIDLIIGADGDEKSGEQ